MALFVISVLHMRCKFVFTTFLLFVLGVNSAVAWDRLAAKARLAPALEMAGVDAGAETFVRIFKEESQLELYADRDDGRFVLLKTYPVCAWSGELGPKRREGDGQAPEGFYWVSRARLNPNSTFHLSFNLGFPNAYDRAHGRTGSFLMVHGDCVSIGCYAMTDPAIEEIYLMLEQALNAGQPFVRVHVFPFRMSEENLAAHSSSGWGPFWSNLKAGYDWFETHGRPPNVEVEGRRYVFSPD